MTYAIIEASGKQFRVEPGRFYDFDRLPVDEEGNVDIDKVLLVSHEGETMVGQPHVQGAVVSGTVMRHLRGRKIIVYKMKPKKKTRKKRGHRQELTRLMINTISVGGTTLAGEVQEQAAASSTAESDTLQASEPVDAIAPTAAEEE
ncbi:MAG: 50S ribosomal protein L21 [Cyanobacteria bacterium P01_C01_bin.120]